VTAVVRVYESELRVLTHETLCHPNVETGGDLFGLWSHGGGPTVFLVSRPGLLARRSQTEFQQDVQTHRKLEETAWNAFGIQCVGLWHSHHQIGLHDLSDGDRRRTARYSARHRRPKFCDLLSYLTHAAGRPSVNVKPFVYSDASSGTAEPSELLVLKGVSPLRRALRMGGPSLAADVADALAEAPHEREFGWISVASRPNARWFSRFRKRRETFHEAVGASVDVPGELVPIDDIGRFMDRYLKPIFERTPAAVECMVLPDPDLARLDVIVEFGDAKASIHIGWDGFAPVVLDGFCQSGGNRWNLPKQGLGAGMAAQAVDWGVRMVIGDEV
jgi:hypothetical protein